MVTQIVNCMPLHVRSWEDSPKEQWLPPASPPMRKLPLQSSTCSQTLQFLPLCPCAFWAAVLALEFRVSESVRGNPSAVHLRGVPGTPAALVSLFHNLHWFSTPEFAKTSTPRNRTLGWVAWCGQGTHHSSRGPLLPRCPFPFLSHMHVTSPFHISVPSTSLEVAYSVCLYLFGFSSLDLRQFSLMVVL